MHGKRTVVQREALSPSLKRNSSNSNAQHHFTNKQKNYRNIQNHNNFLTEKQLPTVPSKTKVKTKDNGKVRAVKSGEKYRDHRQIVSSTATSTSNYPSLMISNLLEQAGSIRQIFEITINNHCFQQEFIEIQHVVKMYNLFSAWYKSFKKKHKECIEHFSYDQSQIHKHSTKMKQNLLDELKRQTKRRKQLQQRLDDLLESTKQTIKMKDKDIRKLQSQLNSLGVNNFENILPETLIQGSSSSDHNNLNFTEQSLSPSNPKHIGVHSRQGSKDKDQCEKYYDASKSADIGKIRQTLSPLQQKQSSILLSQKQQKQIKTPANKQPEQKRVTFGNSQSQQSGEQLIQNLLFSKDSQKQKSPATFNIPNQQNQQKIQHLILQNKDLGKQLDKNKNQVNQLKQKNEGLNNQLKQQKKQLANLQQQFDELCKLVNNPSSIKKQDQQSQLLHDNHDTYTKKSLSVLKKQSALKITSQFDQLLLSNTQQPLLSTTALQKKKVSFSNPRISAQDQISKRGSPLRKSVEQDQAKNSMTAFKDISQIAFQPQKEQENNATSFAIQRQFQPMFNPNSSGHNLSSKSYEKRPFPKNFPRTPKGSSKFKPNQISTNQDDLVRMLYVQAFWIQDQLQAY